MHWNGQTGKMTPSIHPQPNYAMSLNLREPDYKQVALYNLGRKGCTGKSINDAIRDQVSKWAKEVNEFLGEECVKSEQAELEGSVDQGFTVKITFKAWAKLKR
jgi:hypothetical protein